MMRASTPLACALAAALAAAAPVVAHHTFANYYLEDDTIEIEGRIVEFQYQNPHSWLHVEGLEPGARASRLYSAEWVGTSRLEREGITRTTLRSGDMVRIWASPHRNPSDNCVHLKRIRRVDGWQWGGNAREVR